MKLPCDLCKYDYHLGNSMELAPEFRLRGVKNVCLSCNDKLNLSLKENEGENEEERIGLARLALIRLRRSA